LEKVKLSEHFSRANVLLQTLPLSQEPENDSETSKMTKSTYFLVIQVSKKEFLEK